MCENQNEEDIVIDQIMAGDFSGGCIDSKNNIYVWGDSYNGDNSKTKSNINDYLSDDS